MSITKGFNRLKCPWFCLLFVFSYFANMGIHRLITTCCSCFIGPSFCVTVYTVTPKKSYLITEHVQRFYFPFPNPFFFFISILSSAFNMFFESLVTAYRAKRMEQNIAFISFFNPFFSCYPCLSEYPC